ncbi:hypothetical protein NP493_598g00000 [Ridgeia piscesae]|uniref:CUB domain-containing protein n=1 Tax=Ridgeia piscesae TaxID=27915 RepID=A0AAD9KTK0_RIDPI|nr:hypothetical protein NP493_598g00000 [Ridgeia piscesae]
MCGGYDKAAIDVAVFTTGHEAEVEFCASALRPSTSFALSYTFVNTGLDSTMHSALTHNHMKPFKVAGSLCSWSMDVNDCGDSCWIFSPGYPGIYPPNVTCQYRVTTDDPDTMLQLTFDNSGTGLFYFSSLCREDYISISDGDNSSESFIGRFCGRHLPSVTTSGRELRLTFVSGLGLPVFQHMGFRASVVAITKEWNPSGQRQPGSRCDWVFRVSSGSISSPDHWLPAGTECRYLFDVTSGAYLEFIVNIYGLRGQCDDEVLVYNGTTLVTTLCSADVVKRQTHVFYVDSRRSALIYRTTSGQLVSEPDRGFWLSFRLVDGRSETRVFIGGICTPRS